MAQDCREIERLFGTWVELSRDNELFALFALIQRRLGQRGYLVSVKLACDPVAGAARNSARGRPGDTVHP